jgi:DNA-binding HxlR family transcriptional regulator
VARSYAQYCGLAHALDLVGERWTLLIARELLAGPRRYTDLAQGLVSVPTNVLATRLREMESNGLVRRRRLPSPAASVAVYELTEEGESLGGAMNELARWGMRTLPPAPLGQPFRAHWLVLALGARFDPAAAAGVSESYEFDIEGDGVVCFEIVDGEGQARLGPTAKPIVRIAADGETFAALTGGAISTSEALKMGARIEGSRTALARMRTILPTRSGGGAAG